MLGDDGSIRLGTYSKSFATAWADVRAKQTAEIDAAGYWKRPLSSLGTAGLGAWVGVAIVGALWFLIAAAGSAIRRTTIFDSPWFALGAGLLVPGVLALVLYRRMLPARTTTGSALALRSESFRRFLEASEGKHVEWAWKHGLLREYSAWAVALGAAEAWERALQGSSVPPAELSRRSDARVLRVAVVQQHRSRAESVRRALRLRRGWFLRRQRRRRRRRRQLRLLVTRLRLVL